MRLELQHVSIPIPKGGADRGRAFYGGLLGLEEREVPPKLDPAELTWFRAGGDLELHLFESGEPQPRSQHFCLRLDEGLEELRARLEAAGVETEDTPEIVGRPRFMCRDPFGNRVELTQWA
ncbi:MAG TPA: VOC family protein [Gaiellaceae bacterium]|jgi:catechol 2,3-dioxygenase-like lactoylglutathione lyase family enzyme|nr:VOC family protein [Gaiellaceae bacterium]